MFKQIAVAAALVIASSGAMAQQTSKFYAGGELSSSEFDGGSTEGGFGFFGGYKFTDNAGVEIGFNRLASDKLYGYDIGLNQLNVSFIGTLPLSSGFSLYGRLGYNDLRVSASNDDEFASEKFDDGVVYGVGLNYAFTPAISGRVEVQKPISEITKLTAGVSFSF